MALSDILGSGMTGGAGLAGALAQGTQGMLQGLDKRREMNWQDEQRAQLRNTWNLKNQEQQIAATVTPGATDAERLDNLIGVAEGMGRGEVADRLRAQKKALIEQAGIDATALGARSILLGQFDQAVQHLNKSGLWGQVSRIRPKVDPATGQASQDMVTIEYVDPATGQAVPSDVPVGAIAAAASDPKNFVDKVLEHQKNAGALAGREATLTQKQNEFNRTQAERERHNRALEMNAALRAKMSGSKGGAQKLTDYDKKMRDRLATNGGDLAEALEFVVGQSSRNQELNRWHKELMFLAGGYGSPENIQEAKGQLPVPPRASTPKPAGSPSSLPPAVAAKLKEGIKTTYANGDIWTLRNGKPVKLN